MHLSGDVKTGRNLLLCYDSLEPSKYCDEDKPFHLMFKHHPLLKIIWEKEWKFVEIFLYRHYDITAIFHNELLKWPADTAELINDNHDIQKLNKNIVDGCYVFTSMFNHSCVPNVELHCDINNNMHMIVCQNVTKGEELFVSYK